MRRALRRESNAPITVELECLECHMRTSAELSPSKFNTLSASWKLQQQCDVCGKLTDWSFAEPAVEAEELLDFWEWLATTGEYFMAPQAEPQHERRREPRVDLNVPLRIATMEGDQEDVTSENISKNGLCFSSTRIYRIGERVRVTIQPPGAVAPQEKIAVIVRSHADASAKTLYGARLEG